MKAGLLILTCAVLVRSNSAFATVTCKATKSDQNGGFVNLPLAPETTNGVPGLYQDAVVYINAADMTTEHSAPLMGLAINDQKTGRGVSLTASKTFDIHFELSDGSDIELNCVQK